MRYIYQNKSDQSKVVTLVNELKTSISHIPMAAGAKLELSYPGLDTFVPHVLARVNEQGTDISHTVIAAQRAAAESAAAAAKAEKEDSKSDETSVAPTTSSVQAQASVVDIKQPKAKK